MNASTRRTLLATLALLAAAPAVLAADAWPNKPIRLIVPFPPGGSSDIAARLVAPKLAQALGQPFVIDNKPGAGGGLGLEATAKSPPDGYTFVLAAAGGMTINPSLYPKLSYSPSKDLTPVGGFGTSQFVLIANDQLPARDVRQLIAQAKAAPGRMSYASGGNGTAMHLAGELFKSMTGTHIVHIPYRGTGPATLATMAGETQFAIADLTSVQQAVKGGKVRILAVLGAQRTALAPEIPTLAEAGVPGYDAVGWFALFAPAGTPPAIVERMNKELTAVLGQPEVRERFAVAGLEPQASTPQQLAQRVQDETAKWAKVVKVSGAKLD
jgi:tripartite-type tricarboxylate transporter receptor subunit TctC